MQFRLYMIIKQYATCTPETVDPSRAALCCCAAEWLANDELSVLQKQAKDLAQYAPRITSQVWNLRLILHAVMSSTQQMQSFNPVRVSLLMRKSPSNPKTGLDNDGLVNLTIKRPTEL